ncbi:hypothetical protein M404DRAFT_992209 [Pisolithus tinctorius Marx 270]|uniref:Uncharacterized protein n=1 Tax=Pisolithus tinctorius Marx 270 TaxID=870435 RepID=A0A0C3JXU5_PISTI|nr:hypothetical protein M404DRAFT_992209 [Pisolithus tinctorius Marx 270]
MTRWHYVQENDVHQAACYFSSRSRFAYPPRQTDKFLETLPWKYIALLAGSRFPNRSIERMSLQPYKEAYTNKYWQASCP